MPIVAAGNQGYSVASMLVPLLEAAIRWMERGLPLDCIKIVEYSEEKGREAMEVFSKGKALYQQLNPPSQADMMYSSVMQERTVKKWNYLRRSLSRLIRTSGYSSIEKM